MTQHYLDRARGRMNLSCHAACKLANHADILGKSASDFSAKERKYLQNLSSEGKYAIVYGRYCFIFDPHRICITVFSIPSWFGKKYNYEGKRQIRHPKKYLRYQCDSKHDAIA